MKRTILFMIIIFFISVITSAKISYLGLGVNYFIPSSQDFKDIYGNGLQYGFELGFDMSESLTLWLGSGYFKKKGELTYTKEETDLKILNLIRIGIHYKFLKEMITPYIGAGFSLISFKETNIIGSAEDLSFGYSGQFGILIKFLKRISLDLGVNASYCKVNPADTKANIGGNCIFAGLKYYF